MQDTPRIHQLLNELEIKNLLVKERYYRDTKQWSKLRECYHSDSAKTQITITWFNGHIDGFVAGSERMAKSGATSAHTISPVEVSINGDKAVSESTGAILARFSHNSQDYDCLSYGRFVSRLVREDETWKLLSLEVIYDKDSLQPVTPSPAAADIAIDPKARQSYKCLDWVLAKHGFAIDRGLPGTDKSGSGEALMAACFSWLQSTDK